MVSSTWRRSVLCAAALTLTLGLAACSSSSSSKSSSGTSSSGTSSSGTSSSPGTSSSGTSAKPTNIKLVYITGDMPYFNVVGGGKFTGVDGALLDRMSADLNVHLTPSLAEFPAFLAGIQSGRYNIGVGGVAWTKERAATGLFTDPVYYSPIVVMCKHGTTPNTVTAFSGLTVGTAASTLQNGAFRALKGVKSHTYPSSATELQDLIAGRVDCVSDDTLTLTYVRLQRPDLHNFDVTVIQPPTAAQIAANSKLADFNPYMVAWYLSKDQAPLIKRLNTEIDSWYKSGFTAGVLKKWGVPDPSGLLTPIPAFNTARRGVDRPSSWTAPSA